MVGDTEGAPADRVAVAVRLWLVDAEPDMVGRDVSDAVNDAVVVADDVGVAV